MRKGTVIFLILIFVLCIYFLSMLSPVLYSGQNRVKDVFLEKITITGHRGAAGHAPENTIASVKKALELKVDRIEIDVRLTKDQVVVCMHDNTINRTTTGQGNVNNFTFSELTKFSASVGFSEKFKDEKVPSLDNIFEIINGKATIVIEIKDGDELYPGIEKRVVNLINKHHAKNWSIVHSFNDSVLIRIHKLDKDVVLHKLLIADFPLFHLIYDGYFRLTNLEFYTFVDEFSSFYPFTTRRLIKEVHSLGKKINVWTVNDSIRINRLINLGVDGIITDYPNFAE